MAQRRGRAEGARQGAECGEGREQTSRRMRTNTGKFLKVGSLGRRRPGKIRSSGALS